MAAAATLLERHGRGMGAERANSVVSAGVARTLGKLDDGNVRRWTDLNGRVRMPAVCGKRVLLNSGRVSPLS